MTWERLFEELIPSCRANADGLLYFIIGFFLGGGNGGSILFFDDGLFLDVCVA